MNPRLRKSIKHLLNSEKTKARFAGLVGAPLVGSGSGLVSGYALPSDKEDKKKIALRGALVGALLGGTSGVVGASKLIKQITPIIEKSEKAKINMPNLAEQIKTLLSVKYKSAYGGKNAPNLPLSDELSIVLSMPTVLRIAKEKGIDKAQLDTKTLEAITKETLEAMQKLPSSFPEVKRYEKAIAKADSFSKEESKKILYRARNLGALGGLKAFIGTRLFTKSKGEKGKTK